MTPSDETTIAPLSLPVPLAGEEREEVEGIVRTTRRALAAAFERLRIDAMPRVPDYASRGGGAS